MRKAVLAAGLALLAAAVPAAARFGMPEPLTPRGRLVEGIYAQIAVAGILVFLLVFALLVWVLVRYRESSGHGRATHERERHNLKAEVFWTVGPLLVVSWIGFIGYQGLVALDGDVVAPEDADLAVTVTGFQWAWEMDYGGGVKVTVTATPDAGGNVTYSDRFHLPADTPVLLNVTGADVIHAFNIMDANRAFVAMDDANPAGPHKVAQHVLEFPAGDYLVQCKEMCYNPGHAYMRAEIVVEPREDFDFWLEQRRLAVGADLVEAIALDASGGEVAALPPQTLIAGTRLLFTVEAGAQDLTFGFTGASDVTVEANARGTFAFDAPAPGTYTLTANGEDVLSVEAIVPDATLEFTLGDYFIEPDSQAFEAGKTYLIRAANAGATTHNLFIGHHEDLDIIAQSPNIPAGATGTFVFRPTETGRLDTWCQVPGHFGLGMHGEATVA